MSDNIKLPTDPADSLDDVVDALGGDEGFKPDGPTTLEIDDVPTEDDIEVIDPDVEDDESGDPRIWDHKDTLDLLENGFFNEEILSDLDNIRGVANLYLDVMDGDDSSITHLSEVVKEKEGITCPLSDFFTSNVDSESNLSSATIIAKKYLSRKLDTLGHVLIGLRDLFGVTNDVLKVVDEDLKKKAGDVYHSVSNMESVYLRRGDNPHIVVGEAPLKELKETLDQDNNSNPYFDKLYSIVTNLNMEDKSLTNVAGLLSVTVNSISEEVMDKLSRASGLVNDLLLGIGEYDKEDFRIESLTTEDTVKLFRDLKELLVLMVPLESTVKSARYIYLMEEDTDDGIEGDFFDLCNDGVFGKI